MNNLLCLVGPTGVGKTAKAIDLSKQQPSILISADSRQVYRGMDIVTGKDHPKDIFLYGIDILDPEEQSSVSVWYDAVTPHLEEAWKSGKQAIVVGGTGLYVKAITSGIATMQIPINQKLRNELGSLSITKLQEKLAELDNEKFTSLNYSDSLNSRRLIRAIEVASSPHIEPKQNPLRIETKIIGLTPGESSIYRQQIEQRVLSRIEAGAVEETRELLSKYDRNLQSMSAIGYKSIIKYLDKLCTKDEMIQEWVSGELAYAKRQMTWFRKQPVIWYDVATSIGE